MYIYNPENIKEFKPNSKIVNDLEKICQKYKMKPNIQVFKSLEDKDYRGLTFGNNITLYWSDLETPKSIAWVFCHEIRHLMMAKKPKVFEDLENLELALAEKIRKRKITKMSVRSTYKILYEIGITETICDLFATEEVGKDYGADWYGIRLKTKARRKKCPK